MQVLILQTLNKVLIIRGKDLNLDKKIEGLAYMMFIAWGPMKDNKFISHFFLTCISQFSLLRLNKSFNSILFVTCLEISNLHIKH